MKVPALHWCLDLSATPIAKARRRRLTDVVQRERKRSKELCELLARYLGQVPGDDDVGREPSKDVEGVRGEREEATGEKRKKMCLPASTNT